VAGIHFLTRELPLRRTALAAALIPCALVLTACGSNSGTAVSVSSGGATTAAASGPSNADLTQVELLARFKTALASVTALHIKGTMSDSGESFSMDMQINKDSSAQGTIVSSGMTIPMIAVDGVDYIQVTSSMASIIKASAGSDASLVSKIIVGKWISSKSAVGSQMTDGFSSMTNFSEMTKELGTGSGDTFSYLGTSTVDGQPVAQYKDVSKNTGDGTSSASASATTTTSTLDIPLTGTPLPIQESGANNTGTMVFTWNEPTKISAPAAADIITLPAS
jgi:hypothetical protein